MLKQQKGVTLVALVITIIVLLILAGVSIAMLTGENGVLTKATQSVSETKIAEEREAAQTDINAAMAEYYNEKYVNSGSVESFIAYLGANTNLLTQGGTEDNKKYTYTLTPATGPTTAIKITTKSKTKTSTGSEVTQSATVNENGGLSDWENDNT